mgnify:CR=1 FL=1
MKKIGFRDKMTKKNGGGTPGLSICDKLYLFDQGTGMYMGRY